MIVSFLLATVFSLVRGLKIILRGKLPKGLLLGHGVGFRHMHKISFGREDIRLGNNVSIGDYSL